MQVGTTLCVNHQGMSGYQFGQGVTHAFRILCIDVNTMGQHDLEDYMASVICCVPHGHVVLQSQQQV